METKIMVKHPESKTMVALNQAWNCKVQGYSELEAAKKDIAEFFPCALSDVGEKKSGIYAILTINLPKGDLRVIFPYDCEQTKSKEKKPLIVVEANKKLSEENVDIVLSIIVEKLK